MSLIVEKGAVPQWKPKKITTYNMIQNITNVNDSIATLTPSIINNAVTEKNTFGVNGGKTFYDDNGTHVYTTSNIHSTEAYTETDTITLWRGVDAQGHDIYITIEEERQHVRKFVTGNWNNGAYLDQPARALGVVSSFFETYSGYTFNFNSAADVYESGTGRLHIIYDVDVLTYLYDSDNHPISYQYDTQQVEITNGWWDSDFWETAAVLPTKCVVVDLALLLTTNIQR